MSTGKVTFSLVILATSLFFSGVLLSGHSMPQSPPNIAVSGYLSADKATRGKPLPVVVVMEIPGGFHVNSNRPLEKFLIPTKLEILPPNGIRVGPVAYPRPVVRNLKFSKNKVSVFEGKTTMRFTVTLPGNYSSSATEIKARLKYQSCNDDFCFPPQTREISIPITVAGQ